MDTGAGRTGGYVRQRTEAAGTSVLGSRMSFAHTGVSRT
jgi:hypothetical protein